MIGSELDGKYKIEAELGSGGAGTVYRGLNSALGTGVAIKVIHPSLSQSLELRHRFEREAKALASLSHPNIVSIVDSGVSGESAYLVMDLLEGETLAGRLKRGPLSLGVAAPLLRELLGALAYVHSQGLVHRDVKPANVFLEFMPGGAEAPPGKAIVPPRVRLLDFGLAKFLAPEAGDPALTRAGQVFGTPSYMAPEQIAGQAADARADLYATGIVFFEMLSGAPPFRGDGSEVLRQHVMEDLPIAGLPSEAATPDIVALLQRATAKTRAERFASATEMLEALDAAAAPSVGDEGGADTALEVPHPGAEPGRGPPSRSGSVAGELPRSFGGQLFRLIATIGVVVSLSAFGVAAFAAYVFVTPGHEQERRSLEVALRLPPPKHGVASASLSPLSSGHALGASVSLLPSVSPGSTGGSRDAPLPAPPGSAEPFVPPAGSPGAAVPVVHSPHEPVPNPWASVPRELARLLGKSNHGGSIDKKEIAAVHQYNAKHPTDPRGHLLLARGYLNRHWFKDAAGEYAIALEVNQDARGDPRMLPDLVRLVEFGSNDAAKMITDVYADTAAAAVDRALVSPPNPEAQSRLERLKSELPRPNPPGP